MVGSALANFLDSWRVAHALKMQQFCHLPMTDTQHY